MLASDMKRVEWGRPLYEIEEVTFSNKTLLLKANKADTTLDSAITQVPSAYLPGNVKGTEFFTKSFTCQLLM